MTLEQDITTDSLMQRLVLLDIPCANNWIFFYQNSSWIIVLIFFDIEFNYIIYKICLSHLGKNKSWLFAFVFLSRHLILTQMWKNKTLLHNLVAIYDLASMHVTQYFINTPLILRR